MAEEKIILLIDEDGTISAKTAGFKGEACIDALDKLLGSQSPTLVKKTDEYMQQVTIDSPIKINMKRK
ncbi:DUF2997 domain-containing protein [Pseudoalteromonas sp. KJ10-2]|uniref:DUF2997 domain-containing protein n=1 Tax=Psychromonas sp. KJ10-2 TaxID=3391822 RepID=UPI0039B38F33